MTPEQFAALTDIERLDYQKLDPVTDAWATRWLTALADARLEVARLKKLRDKVVEGNQRIVQRNLDLEVEVARYRMSEAESG